MIDLIIGIIAAAIVIAVGYLYLSGKKKGCGDSCSSCEGCNTKKKR